MSIPVSSLGSQVFVHLPGMSNQVSEPCQDMHICGVCKLSFTSVENFLTHKKIVCGKEIIQPTSPSDISISTSSASQDGAPPITTPLQTILQHPSATFLTPGLSSTGGNLIHSSGEVSVGGHILRVLLGNNEILLEKAMEPPGTTIGDLLPDETLQLLPDLQMRKNLNEKGVLNDSCDKDTLAKDKGDCDLPLGSDVVNQDNRSVKKQSHPMEQRMGGEMFQPDEENVVSLLANQLVTANSSVKQGAGGMYPVSLIRVPPASEEINPSPNNISIDNSSPSSNPSEENSDPKIKEGVMLRRRKGKSSEEVSSKSNFESAALDKIQQLSKDGKQDQGVKVCLVTGGAVETEEVTTSARKRMPGLFKQRKVHVCAVEACDFSTTFTKDLIRHMRKHTGERPFKCEKCSRWFSRGDKLRTHLRIHAGFKPHACSLCPYKAVDSGSLRKHMRVHTDERPYKCQICPYSARDSSQLTVHLRTHTGDHPFICSYESCNASFKTSSDLKRHTRIHTGEKPFQCELCPYKCSISSNLKAHIRQSHSENKSLSCSICSFSASSKHALKEHEKCHSQPTNERDVLRCNSCGFSCFGVEAMSEHLKSNPHCESASSESTTKNKEAENAQRKPFRCSDCDFTCMMRGNLKNHIKRKHCISEDSSGNNAKKKGRGAAKDASRGRKARGGRRGNMSGEGPPFCLRSHQCPLCSVSFVREDSWRSHIRQHQTKGEGLEIPLGPMMPSLVDSSEAAIISTIEETPCSESPGDSLISLPEEQNNKLMGGRPFIITFEGNEKSQADQGNAQGGTEMMSEFEEPPGENHSVLLYVQADQETNQNQDDDENLRSGAEILASLNQSIPVNSSLSNNTKPIAIAPAPSSSQQHTILLATPQQSGSHLKGHITTGNTSTCQYIALPNEQTAIMDQLTAALQPGLQYMISGPLEAIMALPSALEQRQMTVTSENQKADYENPIISVHLSNGKEEVEMKLKEN